MTTHVLGSAAVPARQAQRRRAALLAHWIRRLALRRRTRRQLAALPDALLADIGVPRCSIDSVAMGLTEDVPRRRR